MLMKHLMSCSTRQSYSVRKVLIQCVKTSESYRDNSQRYFHLYTNLSRKSPAPDPRERDTPDESFEYIVEKRKEKLKNRRRKVTDEISDYLSKTCPEEMINKIPKKCFKRNRLSSEQIYLVNTYVADAVVQCLRDNLVKDGTVVLETNPGLGILSRKLVDAGVPKLHLHEPSSVFHTTLKEFCSKHSDKVFFHITDFLSLWKIAYQDKMDQGTRMQDILSPYPKKNWVEEPSLKIVGCVQSSSFIKHLIMSIVFQSGIMIHCRPELYILTPPSLYQRLSSSGKDGYLRYRSITVLFQMLFDFELLEKVSRKAYLPWAMPHSTKKRKADEVALLNEEWLYLMKIVPKQNLYEIIPPEKLPALWYFVRHHFLSRRRKVIQEMESWIPGCGVRLVLEGFDIFTEFGDLTPSQVLHIFQLFSSWPEYQDSSFLSSMETTLLKFEENLDDGDEKLKNKGKEGDKSDNDEQM